MSRAKADEGMNPHINGNLPRFKERPFFRVCWKPNTRRKRVSRVVVVVRVVCIYREFVSRGTEIRTIPMNTMLYIILHTYTLTLKKRGFALGFCLCALHYSTHRTYIHRPIEETTTFSLRHKRMIFSCFLFSCEKQACCWLAGFCLLLILFWKQ